MFALKILGHVTMLCGSINCSLSGIHNGQVLRYHYKYYIYI